jgi:hypothetical protein
VSWLVTMANTVNTAVYGKELSILGTQSSVFPTSYGD